MNTAYLAKKLFDGFSGRSPVEAQLIRFCEMIATGQQNEIYAAMRAEKALTDEQKKEIISAVNQAHFLPQRLEWTNHGIIKTFRFWTADEKAGYLRSANEIAEVVRSLTPHVCFGFGSVLGMIRDDDFIPHDDDMDLIAAFPHEEGVTFGKLKQQLRDALEAAGFTVHGDNLSHFGVNKEEGTATDIFIGIADEDETVSWFPSKRGLHKFSAVFPVSSFRLFGVDCPIPGDPIAYLENTYGKDWREPIPNWNHPWDQTQYQDFIE